jgi:hypothetical protein
MVFGGFGYSHGKPPILGCRPHHDAMLVVVACWVGAPPVAWGKSWEPIGKPWDIHGKWRFIAGNIIKRIRDLPPSLITGG